MNTDHWKPTIPQRRERLVNLAKFRRAGAPPEVSELQTEAQAPQTLTEIFDDESPTGARTD